MPPKESNCDSWAVLTEYLTARGELLISAESSVLCVCVCVRERVCHNQHMHTPTHVQIYVDAQKQKLIRQIYQIRSDSLLSSNTQTQTTKECTHLSYAGKLSTFN